jgi:hypothetical protein
MGTVNGERGEKSGSGFSVRMRLRGRDGDFQYLGSKLRLIGGADLLGNGKSLRASTSPMPED